MIDVNGINLATADVCTPYSEVHLAHTKIVIVPNVLEKGRMVVFNVDIFKS